MPQWVSLDFCQLLRWHKPEDSSFKPGSLARPQVNPLPALPLHRNASLLPMFLLLMESAGLMQASWRKLAQRLVSVSAGRRTSEHNKK